MYMYVQMNFYFIRLNKRSSDPVRKGTAAEKNAAEMQDMMADFAFGPTGQ